jgi:glycosyltransferase involved in cell wall biosynthesis
MEVGEYAMKISVIIPAYNAEQYIAKAIESCLSQTYAPHEIIVIDDGSTDGTAAVAESFPSPVRVIRLAKNMGVSVARNRGVQVSTGDWLAFLDADDWFLPEKLERQRRCALENEQAVLIYAGWRIVSVDGVESLGRFTPPGALLPMLRFRCNLPLLCILLRRDAFDSVGGFDPSLRRCQDWDLWLRIAARYSVESFAAVPAPLAVYRRVAGSLAFFAMPYFHPRISIIRKGSCLFGTSGIFRFLCRRKISAYNYYDTSESLRDEGSLSFLPFILMSFILWPFPCVAMPNRYKVAIVMALQTCHNLFPSTIFQSEILRSR